MTSGVGDKKRTWKDHLLSSGLPLEHSVRTALKSFGIHADEYHYEREDGSGATKVFSVDLYGAYKTKPDGVLVQLLVECKYRHDSVRWVFAPDDYYCWFENDFVILDDLISGRKLRGLPNPDSEYHGLPFLPPHAVCSGGAEIIGNNADRGGIREGLQQLRYAVMDLGAGWLSDGWRWLGRPDRPVVLVPILVTTAELWRMCDGVTLKAIREADEIAEIADQRGALFCHQEPSPHDSRYAQQRVERAYAEVSESQREAICRQAGRDRDWLDGLFRWGCSVEPNLFVVVHHGSFAEQFRRLLQFFDEIAALRAS